MKISDSEKLILMMLSDIYDKLKIDGGIDPDFIRNAIYTENTWALRHKYSGIPFEDNETPPIVREVFDILDMWRMIEFSYAELNNEDKEFVEKEAILFGKNPKFSGFDGNNESKYMSTVEFLVNDLDRYREFKGRDFNSHAPKLDIYHRMLTIYKPIVEKNSDSVLLAQDLVNILKEKIHPSNR